MKRIRDRKGKYVRSGGLNPKILGLRLPDEKLAKIELMAMEQGISPTEQARRLILERLDQLEKKENCNPEPTPHLLT